MVLADSHAHLLEVIFDNDREKVIERAKNSNVEYILNCIDASNTEEMERGFELAKKFDNIFLCVGLHPFQTQQWNDKIKNFILSNSKKFVAIGEIGLDVTFDVPMEIQKIAFRSQLELAKELELPVVIHCRRCFREVHKIVEEVGITRGVLHTFSGTINEAEEFLKTGFYISFSGALTYSKKAKEVARRVDLERILLETDSPYLSPLPYKGARNEPSYIVRTAEELSRVKDCPLEEVATNTTTNFINLFIKRKNQNGT